MFQPFAPKIALFTILLSLETDPAVPVSSPLCLPVRATRTQTGEHPLMRVYSENSHSFSEAVVDDGTSGCLWGTPLGEAERPRKGQSLTV